MSDVEHIKPILDEKSDKLKMNSEVKKNGGARPGAGRPKGKLAKKTLTALEAKTRFVERVHQHVDKLFDAQMDLAVGEKFLYVKHKERDDKGRVIKVYHELVTDRETITEYLDDNDALNDEDNFYYISTKPANNQALQGLLDRAFGKAPEKIEIEGGFFKADNINITIVNPQHGTDVTADIIDANPVEEAGDKSSAESETAASA